MDHDRILAGQVEHADLEESAVGAGSDQHRQVVVHRDPADSVPDRVIDVGAGDPVLARWITDPHLDNVACLAAGRQQVGEGRGADPTAASRRGVVMDNEDYAAPPCSP